MVRYHWSDDLASYLRPSCKMIYQTQRRTSASTQGSQVTAAGGLAVWAAQFLGSKSSQWWSIFLCPFNNHHLFWTNCLHSPRLFWAGGACWKHQEVRIQVLGAPTSIQTSLGKPGAPAARLLMLHLFKMPSDSNPWRVQGTLKKTLEPCVRNSGRAWASHISVLDSSSASEVQESCLQTTIVPLSCTYRWHVIHWDTARSPPSVPW